MIPIRRPELSPDLVARFAAKVHDIEALEPSLRAQKARDSWRNSDGSRRAISAILKASSIGRELCMYCSDGRGTSVDHYEPIAKNPSRAWDWTNHILACTVCNSLAKRADFPRNASGEPLYLDPVRDEPSAHLVLTPSTGQYVGRTDRGEYTADRLLNDELLARGRRAAWLDALDLVIDYVAAKAKGDAKGALLCEFKLLQRPNLDAFYSMLLIERSVNASRLIPREVIEAIDGARAEFWSWLGLRAPAA